MTDQDPSAPQPAADAPRDPVAEPTQETAAATAYEPPLDSGSQVVVVVSRGVSPTPLGVPAAVPDVLGKPQGEALAKLQEVGLTAQLFNDYSAAIAKGKVIGQLPDAGLTTPKGTAVVLMVSGGPRAAEVPQVGLPDVVGLAEGDALSKLQHAGLATQVARDFSAKVPEGVVIATLPNARSLAAVPKRSLMWLWILLGVLALALLAGGVWFMNQDEDVPDVVAGIVATETVESTATETIESTAAAATQVPSVVGMSQKDAEAALEAAGFVPLATKVTTSETPAGDVVAQIPAAETELTSGSQVAIQVAQAAEPPKPSTVNVPNVVGMTQANAQSALVDAGLAPSFVNQANDAPKGSAFEQQPASGQAVAPETVVLVAISTGPATNPPATTVAVPAVIGKTQADAEKALSDANLAWQAIQTYSSTVAKGKVIQQWPPAGNVVAPGTPIAIVVSMGPKPTSGTATVPDVKGMDADQATQALAEVGLIAQVVQIDDPNATPNVVLGQLPAPSSIVPAGSTVLIGIMGATATLY